MSIKYPAAAAVVLALSSPAYAAAYVLDDFTTAQSQSSATVGVYSGTVTLANANRQIYVDSLGTPAATVDISGGFAEFTTSPDGMFAALIYTPLSGFFDLNADTYSFVFNEVVQGGFATAYSIQFQLTFADTSSDSFNVSSDVAPAGAGSAVIVDSTDFTAPSANLSQITEMQIRYLAEPDLSLTLGTGEASVPLPAGAPLLAAGLAAFFGLRRRG